MALNFTNGISPQIVYNSRLGEIKNFLSPDSICLSLDGRDPTVSAGDNVLIGQPLSDGASPLFSGVSGSVVSVTNDTVTIKNDFEGRAYERLVRADKPLSDFSADEIYNMLRWYGIRDRADGMLLSDKLLLCSRPQRIIINCCEPDFRSDAVSELIFENTDALIGGVKILVKALGVSKAVFVCTENNTALIKLLGDAFADENAFVTAVFKQKYPIIPQTIFAALYNRQIPAGACSEKLGYLQISAESTVQTYTSFLTGIPQVYKILSLCGEGMKTKVNVRAPIGAEIREMTDHFGGTSLKKCDLIGGSVFGQKMLGTDPEYVTAATNQIVAVRHTPRRAEKCIRCGECVNACPLLLNPMRYALLHEAKQARRKFIYSDMCIGCGCCEFVCPSDIPLMSVIRGERVTRPDKEDNI